MRTLRNAFSSGRIAQAFMLTGVRGVGKTTTARILARAITYESADGSAGPTVDFPGEGVHCKAILEGRHVDVIEMDAASHNGVSDIREIVDAARYAPVSTRAKVYILDEVHMLSGAAFNALLKTLEEPPAHVKFIFATTEIRKVPVTVLSRCQRFDLRRIEPDTLIAHLSGICAEEGVEAEEAALRLVARAADGSVRDALSLLDQAIAHGAGRIAFEPLTRMLGLVDRQKVFDLFEHVMAGRTAEALSAFAALYAQGADPAGVIGELADITHLVTRLKVAPDAGGGAASPDEVARAAALGTDLSLRTLSLVWQMLLKGAQETAGAPKPQQAADMVLVRLCHAADLPAPDDLARMIARGETGVGAAPPAPSGAPGPGPSASHDGGMRLVSGLGGDRGVPRPQPHRPEPEAHLSTIEDLVARAEAERDGALKRALERYVRPERIGADRLEIGLAEGAPPGLVGQLAQAMERWTGRRVMISLVQSDAATLAERAAETKRSELSEIGEHPLVAAVLSTFPGSRIVNVRYEDDEPPAGEGAAEMPADPAETDAPDED